MYRSLLTDRPEPATEVDSRTLLGNAGTVTLYLSTGPAPQRYLVDVERAEGGHVATITAATRAEALDAYLHPFARSDVPDIFSEAA
jgi:hypothetical protein